ncbi:MAG: hypothetical protein J0L84_01945 [Verrucomicrobia bacterium]|nr:hypothetical protein [Verrucomicrobiota bacterium]
MPSLRTVLALSCLSLQFLRANEASFEMASISIRTRESVGTDLVGTTFRVQSTSDLDAEGVVQSFNGEWYLLEGTIGYQSILQIENLETGEIAEGILLIDIPSAGDENLNFLTDFFEVDRAVGATTAAALEFGLVNLSATATWARASGSAEGGVRLEFDGTVGDLLGTLSFTVPFEIQHYRGTLSYTPPTEVGALVEARIQTQRSGIPDQKFEGPFPLRLAENGTLIRSAARWTGPGDVAFDVLGSLDIEGVEFPVSRIPRRPQYSGTFFFADGDPGTPFTEEYDVWDLFIADANDADRDGIPDLSDPADLPPPQVTPEIRLAVADGNLQLEVKAKAGVTVTMERRDTLASGAWAAVQSFVMANDSDSIVLPLPAGAAAFWRVTAP